MKRIQTIFIHLLGIQAGAALLLRVLNWYNPNMGIWERNVRLIDVMCLCALLLTVVSVARGLWEGRNKNRKEE